MEKAGAEPGRVRRGVADRHSSAGRPVAAPESGALVRVPRDEVGIPLEAGQLGRRRAAAARPDVRHLVRPAGSAVGAPQLQAMARVAGREVEGALPGHPRRAAVRVGDPEAGLGELDRPGEGPVGDPEEPPRDLPLGGEKEAPVCGERQELDALGLQERIGAAGRAVAAPESALGGPRGREEGQAAQGAQAVRLGARGGGLGIDVPDQVRRHAPGGDGGDQGEIDEEPMESPHGGPPSALPVKGTFNLQDRSAVPRRDPRPGGAADHPVAQASPVSPNVMLLPRLGNACAGGRDGLSRPRECLCPGWG